LSTFLNFGYGTFSIFEKKFTSYVIGVGFENYKSKVSLPVNRLRGRRSNYENMCWLLVQKISRIIAFSSLWSKKLVISTKNQ